MISNEVKERLLQKDWYVHCQTKQKSDLLLQACDEAGLRWSEGEKATGYCPQESYPLDIGIRQGSCGLYFDKYDMFEKSSAENITDWFFNAIKNNDSKLTPQNAEQEHWVQIILARLQGIPLEAYSHLDGKWIDAGDDCSIFMDYEYRIKSNPTPIPVSRKIWKKINKEFRFIVMDQNKHFYHCKNAPKSSDKTWLLSEVDHVKSPLIFDSNGINWETSLTERPEDV